MRSTLLVGRASYSHAGGNCSALYTLSRPSSSTLRSRGWRQGPGDRVFTRVLTPLIDGLGHARNVVLDSASFSISKAFVLAKSPFLFSIACCAGAVGVRE